MRGVEESVRLHIDRGDEMNARDEQGMTPLMLSASRNSAKICRLLLEAGAKSDLLDFEGNDALAIAIKAGAGDARLALENHLAPAAATFLGVKPPPANIGRQVTIEERPPEAMFEPPSDAEKALEKAVATAISASLEEALPQTDWEAENHEAPAAGDPTLVAQTFATQAAITLHIPLDTSADWSDFEVFLPDLATPLPRDVEGDIRERLRALILRASRESSVPGFAVEDLSRESDGSISEDGDAQLRMVLNDLGAEVDERLEIDFPFESHVVFVDPKETEEEEKQVDAALAYLDDLASRRNDPIRIYLKTGLRGKLLSAEVEAGLAKAMESSIAKALDALSLWDEGLARICESAELIRSGIHPLRWMTLGQDDEAEEMGIVGSVIAAEPEEVLGDDSREVTAGQRDSANFFEGIDSLNKFRASTRSSRGQIPQRCRQILEDLRLKRDFLLGLTYASGFEKDERGAQFERAIDGYLSAREHMTTANLKLALSIAKKYLYTEEPFDDLIQEANIGLMKAVDKFDWRRGFRFSTYATPWIRQNVQRYVADKCTVIRTPIHVHESTQKILRHMRVAETRDGRAPSPQEIADALSIPLKKVKASLRAAAGSQVASLDEADESLAIEFAEQFVPKDPANSMVPVQVRASIEGLLLRLKPRDAGIIRMRYGIGVNDAMTLEEIGQRLEVTRERVRQMESKAIRQLQQLARLANFIEQIHGKPDSYYAELELRRLDSLGFRVDKTLTPKALKAKRLDTSRVSFKNDKFIGDEETFDNSESVSVTALEEVLEEARGLGINVDEREEDGSRRIWIEILETSDTSTRMLVWRMLQQGFKFWPKKGYLIWR